MDDPRAVGARLQKARAHAGLSQRQLAFEGCTPAYISRIEAGERTPSLQLLRELGQRLGVSADFLATGSEGMPHGAQLLEAELALRFDDIDEAERLYQDLAQVRNDPAVRAAALAGLGELAFGQGDLQTARERLEEALRLSPDQLGGGPGAAETLGRTYAVLGEMESALTLFEKWLDRAKGREDLLETVRFSVLLANALIDSGNSARAQALLGETIARTSELEDPLVQARLYWSQSRLHTFEQRPDLAARYARKALEIVERTEDTTYIARAHMLLAHVELDRERPEDALRLTRRALELLEGAGNPLEHAKFRIEEARALAMLGESEQAAAIALEAAGVLHESNPAAAGRSYGLVAGAFESLGDRARALELYELAAEAYEGLNNRYLTHIYSRLAQLLEDEGRKDEAFEILKKAMQAQQASQRQT